MVVIMCIIEMIFIGNVVKRVTRKSKILKTFTCIGIAIYEFTNSIYLTALWFSKLFTKFNRKMKKKVSSTTRKPSIKKQTVATNVIVFSTRVNALKSSKVAR